MWSDEQVNDAVKVLWDASESGDVQKVTDAEKDPTEIYVVADGITYTDPLYLKALDKLLADRKIESSCNKDDRETFRRCGEGVKAGLKKECEAKTGS
jgi:hypothetical protein